MIFPVAQPAIKPTIITHSNHIVTCFPDPSQYLTLAIPWLRAPDTMRECQHARNLPGMSLRHSPR